MVSSEQHRDISAQFLERAEDEFEQGDLLQASEKMWGAVAHCVNEIAIANGWPVGSHRLLIENANNLLSRDEGNAVKWRRLLAVAEALHSNFYRAAWDGLRVREAMDDSKELIGALHALSSRAGG